MTCQYFKFPSFVQASREELAPGKDEKVAPWNVGQSVESRKTDCWEETSALDGGGWEEVMQDLPKRNGGADGFC